jgi:hypothetical protein
MSKLRGRLSFANVMSVIAVFIALGGSGYAAFKLPKNSVGTKQLKKNAVTGVKVKAGSLTGGDIDARSLTGSDIKVSTLGTVPTATRATTAGHADSAGDATTLQGSGPGAFVHGDGAMIVGRRDLGTAAAPVTLVNIPGVASLTTDCSAGPEAELDLKNTSGGAVDFSFYWEGVAAPEFGTLPNGGQFTVVTGGAMGVTWRVATRAAPPTAATIAAAIGFSGPAACTTFAQATAGS